MSVEADPGEKSYPGGAEAGWVKPDGTVVLAAYRSVKPNWGYRIFADADGSVHAALLQTKFLNCSLGYPSIHAERWTLTLFEFENPKGGGLLGGDLSTLGPRLAIHLSPTTAHSAYAGPQSILDLTAAGFTFEQYAWDTGARLPNLWSAAQDNGLQQGIPVFAKGATFWPSDNLRYQKTKVYTPSGGVRDLLTAGMSTTRGYDDFGTDGTDMVWIDAAGRTTETGPFDTLTITTAPFTTDPSQITPRRVRTEAGPGFGASHFLVGCGYAVRSTGVYIRVVRLSDGVSWKLSNQLTDPWGWSEPVAVSCTELFATVQIPGATRLARVRLDSLGPGIPPD
jgi:hypothetical protein